MSLNTATLNSLAGSLLGRTAYTAPATLYAALIIGAVDALTGGTEATGGSYARASVTNNTTNFPAPAAGVVTSATPLTWPTSTAAWGTVNAVRLYDAASGGNLIAGALLTPAATVDATGITVSIPAGNLTLTLANV
ncbi:MAG: hypothetical protein K0R17_1025 [Rariglobus sp.]|jgi:hypothetical protein|nr:hypothetical protein [Rariglobus sp.]